MLLAETFREHSKHKRKTASLRTLKSLTFTTVSLSLSIIHHFIIKCIIFRRKNRWNMQAKEKFVYYNKISFKTFLFSFKEKLFSKNTKTESTKCFYFRLKYENLLEKFLPFFVVELWKTFLFFNIEKCSLITFIPFSLWRHLFCPGKKERRSKMKSVLQLFCWAARKTFFTRNFPRHKRTLLEGYFLHSFFYFPMQLACLSGEGSWKVCKV